LATAGSLEESGPVYGEKSGPVSKEQPEEAQPVAAGPTKVGEYCPKLDDVMAVVGPLVVVAAGAAAPPEATTSATASVISANLCWRYIELLP